ncbi:MAG: hypothetical protein L3J89_05340 [Gammaproteobacteria bacterium]|nr:hypothetical protein [Gammaproteobacteria bacterium]
MDIASIVASVIAVISAFIAIISYRKQKEISKINTNLLLLEKTQDMLYNHPELLGLHGIEKKHLDSCRVSSVEFIYILNSLYSGLAYYTISGESNIELSSYRKEFLNNTKVRKSWELIIREKMIFQGNYTKAIDCYYASL